MSTIFTAVSTEDTAKADSVIAPDFYVFANGTRFDGNAIIDSLYPVPSRPGSLWPYIVMMQAIVGGPLVRSLRRRSVPQTLEPVSQITGDL